MKRKTILSAFFIASAVLTFSSCIIIDGEIVMLNNFDYNLRGTWVSNDPSSYSGTLTITHNRITITGYNENQTPQGGNDSRRPFRNFTKNVPLEGYSENDRIYIKDRGEWQNGIIYLHYSENFGIANFLRFTFSDREEVLQKE